MGWISPSILQNLRAQEEKLGQICEVHLWEMLILGGARFKHAKKLSKGANTIYFQQVNMKICRQVMTGKGYKMHY